MFAILVSALWLVAGADKAEAGTYISIDVPNTTTAYLGNVTIAGWTYDTSAAITSVAISIDGISRGNATYGVLRSDVCSAGAAPGCPNVGWNMAVDMALLSGGSHSLSLTATTTDGRNTTTTRAFSVTAAQMLVAIDYPSSTGSYLGPTTMSGWAVDTAFPISSVALSIDGVSKGNAGYGTSRTDVCAAVGNDPGCPNVGWSAVVDTALLSAGAHTLTVTATTSDGRSSNGVRTFNVTAAQTLLSIDNPSATGTYLGPIAMYGWAVDTGYPISAVAINIDGVSKGNATYGTSRTDVCAAVGNDPGCPNVGWAITFDAANLAAGAHTLTITGITSDGRQASAARTFNSQVPLTQMSVDLPASGIDYPTTGSFGGWAVDSGYPISYVAVMIDGASVGNAAYGNARTDVCAAGTKPGCPNVGWTLNYGPLSVGSHTLSIAAVTSDGRSATSTTVTFFVTSPVSSTTPKKEYIYLNGKPIAVENHP